MNPSSEVDQGAAEGKRRLNGSVLAVTLGFAVLLAVAISKEFHLLAALPVVVGVVGLALSSRHLLLLGLVATVPLSLNLEQLELGGVGLYLPTEPILFGLLILFLVDQLRGVRLPEGVSQHAITRWVQAMFVWLILTSLLSWDPVVSLKFTVARAWFVAGFFFLLLPIVTRFERQEQFVLLYLVPLLGVILYTLIRHSGYGFDKQAGHWVMEPFFKDHTSYGAVLAMFWFPTLALLLRPNRSGLGKLGVGAAFTILTLGLVLSFTRAAWVSVAAAAALGALMMLGVKLRTLMFGALLGAGLLLLSWDQLLISLERNDQDSSDDLTEHVESISNVSSDASNLERINRWSCALSLWSERPLVGWGPGTYQFVYAPHQRSEHQTIISTNNADRGNAHSEYLGPLAEQGIPGTLIMLGLLLACCNMGFRTYRALRHQEHWRSLWALSLYLGLMTYFIHGVLNNYLDTDKASAPFWGFLAILVIMDLDVRRNGRSAMPYHQRDRPSPGAVPSPR